MSMSYELYDEPCDIFLSGAVSGDVLKKAIGARWMVPDLQEDRSYSGFTGVNIKRLKGLMAVTLLQQRYKIYAWNVPVRYRDMPQLSLNQAFAIARELQFEEGRYALMESIFDNSRSPLYWVFGLAAGTSEKEGGAVRIDRIDGHVWKADEFDQYEHDFNDRLVH